MIWVLVLWVLVAVAALVAAVLVVRKRYVWPSKLLREAAAEVLPVVRAQVDDAVRRAGGDSLALAYLLREAYAYRYVLLGPGSADDGDHDRDKVVVRVDATPAGKLVTRVAPVDRQGRRTGDSRLLLTR